jgi:hypothetical protein
MKEFKDLLSIRLKSNGLKKEAYASLILEKMKQIIFSHFGDLGTRNVECKYYKNNNIYIEIGNMAWKQHIELNKKLLQEIIKKDFPSENIKKLILI